MTSWDDPWSVNALGASTPPHCGHQIIELIDRRALVTGGESGPTNSTMVAQDSAQLCDPRAPAPSPRRVR